MDHIHSRDRDFDVDLESGGMTGENDSTPVASAKKQPKASIPKVYGGFVDGLIKFEERVILCDNSSIINGVSMENVKIAADKTPEREKIVDHNVEHTASNEKRKKISNKKPPRPPRGPSLDAADQKLIKEISELAMLKRARIERLKALKKTRAAKSSSSSTNTFAMVFTILFCLVILFQGISSSRSSPAIFQGSPMSGLDAAGGCLVSVQYNLNPSASVSNGPGFASPNLVEQVAGSDPEEKLKRVAG